MIEIPLTLTQYNALPTHVPTIAGIGAFQLTLWDGWLSRWTNTVADQMVAALTLAAYASQEQPWDDLHEQGD